MADSRKVLLSALAAAFLVCAAPCHGRGLDEDYMVRSWGVAEGLQDAPIISIQEGPDGFFWLTTSKCVVRFDGAKFVRLRGDQWLKLPVTDLRQFFWDGEGNAWVIRGQSVCRFDGRDWQEVPLAEGNAGGTPAVASSLSPQASQDDLPKGASPPVNGHASAGKPEFFCLGSGSGGRTLLASSQGVWRFDGQRLELVPPDSGTPGISAASVDGLGDVWLAAGDRLLRFHDGRYTAEEPFPEKLRAGNISRVFSQADGIVWVQSAAGHLFRSADGQWSQVLVVGLPIDALVETQSGCWLGSAAGLFHWKNPPLVKFIHGAENPFRDVRCMMRSRDGSLWIGTNEGLHRVQRRSVHMFLSQPALDSSTITALCPGPDSNFWAGTKGRGLLAGNPERLQPFATEPPLNAVAISTLLRTRDKVLWIGTGDGRLFRMDGSLTEVAREPNALALTCLLGDRTGQIWVGSRGGLFRLAENGPLVRVPDVTGPVLALNEGRDGTLRIGTSFGGLLEFNPGAPGEGFRRLQGLPTNTVSIIHADADGTIWIVSALGLARWADGQLFFFKKEQGLPDGEIRQMLDDELGHLWLATPFGLTRVAKAELAEVAAGLKNQVGILHLDKNDGLRGQVSRGSQAPLCGRDSAGRLWFCMQNGLAMVDPACLQSSTPIGDVLVARMRVDGGEYETLTHLLPEKTAQNNDGTARRIFLPPETQNIGFSFSVPNTTQQTLFRTWLDGRDAAWSKSFPERSVSYSNLPKGTYRLRVEACNGDGVWREGSRPVEFTIRSHYWENPWFQMGAGITLVVLVAAGSALVVRRLANKHLRKVEEEQARRLALQNERTRIARDIHDDMGSSLTSITLLSQPEKADAGPHTGNHLQKIHDIARHLTRTMEEVVWAVNPKHDTFDGLADYLGNYAQGFLRDAGVRCRLDIPMTLPPCHLATDVRHNLFLAFKEALNNVVKHSSATEVRISLAPGKSDFVLTVEDNGRGFFEEIPSPAGNGLQNMASRLREIGGTCEVGSEPGAGTTVKLVVPVC